MNRFFVSSECISGNTVIIPEEISSQIRKVLRLKDGEIVHFLDNNGSLYEAVIHYSDDKHISAVISEKRSAQGEPDAKISLYIGLTQRDKFEWILQKCTEAGVSRIIPFVSERTLIRKPSDVNSKKERWEKILKEAAEQCGRGRIPELAPAVLYAEAIEAGSKADAALFCWEEERQQTLRSIFDQKRADLRDISVMIGPEGGFSTEEAESAKRRGWVPLTLGKRIYRMETAAVAAVILTLYEIER